MHPYRVADFRLSPALLVGIGDLPDAYDALQGALASAPEWSPEQRLLAAMLQRAWLDLRPASMAEDRGHPYRMRRARAWVCGVYRCLPGMSFADVCLGLGLEPRVVRARILDSPPLDDRNSTAAQLRERQRKPRRKVSKPRTKARKKTMDAAQAAFVRLANAG